MPLHPRAKRLIDMLSLSAPAPHATTASRRDGLKALMDLGRRTIAIDEVLDIEASRPQHPLPLRIYRHQVMAPSPAIVFFHGGGLVAGSIDTHDALCRSLAAASHATVISVEYRLAPEHRHPAAFEDAVFALRWLAEHAADLGLDPTRIAVAGESAGALLATMTTSGATGAGVHIRAQLLLCPVLDLEGDYPSRREFARGYLIDEAMIARDIADCLPIDGSLTGLPSPLRDIHVASTPPTVIVSAECDPFRDEAAAYGAMLEAAGVPIRLTCHPGMIHSFCALNALFPEADLAIKAVVAELAAFLA